MVGKIREIDKKMNFLSWYELYVSDKRKGLLIYRKVKKAEVCSPYVRRPNSWFYHSWQIRVIRLDSGVCIPLCVWMLQLSI